MRKQIILAVAVSVSALSFAQKKELKEAEKAIKDNNFAEAKTALSQVEPMLSSMDDKSKSKYYYLNSVALFAKGKSNKAEVDAALESMEKITDGYGAEVSELKTEMINSFLKKGNNAYEKQNFKGASNNFETVYNLSQKDTIYLYYAAATAVSVPDYDRALRLYNKLKKLGYTGIGTQYYATNKETGEEEILEKGTRDLYVKAGSHIKPGERKTESKKPEIVKNIALIYVSNGDNEKAIAAMKDARAESPDDINLLMTEANVHFKMGNTEEFKKLLEKATKMDPNNPELQYNLGVISAESGDNEAAKNYYKKAIELDPAYTNAYINTAALIINSQQDIIAEMNNLGTSAADDKKYEELKLKKEELLKEAIPYLSKALELNDKNADAAKTLMEIYSILGQTDDYKKMKAKYESLQGQ